MEIIPYGRQNIEQSDIDAVLKTLKADFLTQGPKVREFEEKFANYIGSKYAVAVSNASVALHLSVVALGLKPRQRVITTPITFAATANCVRHTGGEVWFADIDPNSYLISYEKTKQLIRTKPKGFFSGLITVDFAGLPVENESFKKLADDNGLWIIEDSCHAPGAYFLDSNNSIQMCGNGVYADVGVFSFHPVKHIACGEGGMVTTNSKKLYEKIKSLRSHGIVRGDHISKEEGWQYDMKSLGFNFRLTDIQCALGINQLSKNKKGVEKRNKIANRYKEAFKGKIKYQLISEGFYNAYHLFVIEVSKRKEMYNYLKDHNIFSQIHYIPIHTLSYYKEIGYKDANLYNAEAYYNNCLSLPMYPTLKREEQEFIIEKVLNFE